MVVGGPVSPQHQLDERGVRALGAVLLAVLLTSGCGSGTDAPAADGEDPPVTVEDPSDQLGTGEAEPLRPSPVEGSAASATPASPAPTGLDLTALEAEFGARVGVYAVDTADGRAVEHRADDRFAYASTFKVLAAAALLASTTDEQLLEPVAVTAADVVSYSPVTEQHVGGSLPLGELARAAVQQSDNGAANLVLDRLGGPDGLESRLRALGDTVIEMDRTEPALNEATPGDPRDTSTPRAMATTLRAFAVGDALEPADQELLLEWLRGSTTGADLVRAGAPPGWVVGDKSGSGGYGTRNDVAVVWPPGRAPLVVAVMTSADRADAQRSDELVARAAAEAFAALG